MCALELIKFVTISLNNQTSHFYSPESTSESTGKGLAGVFQVPGEPYSGPLKLQQTNNHGIKHASVNNIGVN